MKTILLVEDSEDEVELARIALRRANVAHELVVVRDGRSAIEHLRSDARVPDLVLLDLKLPDLSGVDVLTEIRTNARTAFVPVVVLSSSDEPDDVTASYGAGANSYVRKPVEFDAFAEVAHRVGEYWLTVNERAHREEP